MSGKTRTAYDRISFILWADIGLLIYHPPWKESEKKTEICLVVGLCNAISIGKCMYNIIVLGVMGKTTPTKNEKRQRSPLLFGLKTADDMRCVRYLYMNVCVYV